FLSGVYSVSLPLIPVWCAGVRIYHIITCPVPYENNLLSGFLYNPGIFPVVLARSALLLQSRDDQFQVVGFLSHVPNKSEVYMEAQNIRQLKPAAANLLPGGLLHGQKSWLLQ